MRRFIFAVILSKLVGVNLVLAGLPEDIKLEGKLSKSAIQFEAPSHHHFNLKAPYWAKQDGVPLKVAIKKATVLSFALKSLGKSSGITASIYLCDDANTYCVQKGWNSDTDQARPLEVRPQSKGVHRSEHGFILNEPAYAIELAQKQHKPMLIDFFGIWCPPCNVMDETVFASRRFKKLAARFVLLKLDADEPVSWELKKKYQVGGYPTFILANERGDEIRRVVGSRRLQEFLGQMSQALEAKDLPMSAEARADSAIETRQDDEAQKIIDEHKSEPWALRKSWALKYSSAKKLSGDAYLARLQEILDEPAAGVDRVNAGGELISELSENKASKEKLNAISQKLIDIIDALERSPDVFHKEGYEKVDLMTIKAQAYKDLGQTELAKAEFSKTADEYLALIRSEKLTDSGARGWNLERAYCLGQAERLKEAHALYTKLEQKFDDEFTFFYAHANLYKNLKDWDQVISLGQKAYEKSYGDNKLRCVNLLGVAWSTRAKPGDKERALKLIKDTLQEAKVPVDDPRNRTHRYIKTLKELEKKLST